MVIDERNKRMVYEIDRFASGKTSTAEKTYSGFMILHPRIWRTGTQKIRRNRIERASRFSAQTLSLPKTQSARFLKFVLPDEHLLQGPGCIADLKIVPAE